MSVCLCSYDDSWITGYAAPMMPVPMRGGRFIRPSGPTVAGRGGYRSAGECLCLVHCVHFVNENLSTVVFLLFVLFRHTR